MSRRATDQWGNEMSSHGTASPRMRVAPNRSPKRKRRGHRVRPIEALSASAASVVCARPSVRIRSIGPRGCAPDCLCVFEALDPALALRARIDAAQAKVSTWFSKSANVASFERTRVSSGITRSRCAAPRKSACSHKRGASVGHTTRPMRSSHSGTNSFTKSGGNTRRFRRPLPTVFVSPPTRHVPTA